MKPAFSLPLFALALSHSLFLSKPSYAEDLICSGSIGAITIANLSVARGSYCQLKGTRIQGNLVVGSNATLSAAEVQVSGNLQAQNAAQVSVTFFSRIGGNIQIQRSQGVHISATRVNGNVQLNTNTGNVSARGNDISGNLEAFQNLGGVLIRNNQIGGNLQCQGNQPLPTGNDNVVQGNKEHQCSRL